MDKRAARVVGCVLVVLGALLAAAGICWCKKLGGATTTTCISSGVVMVLAGAFFAVGVVPNISFLKGGGVGPSPDAAPSPPTQQKELDPNLKAQRREIAGQRAVPGARAPAFSMLALSLDQSRVPTSHPMVPMYLLDKNFRILDWNEAFSLAFDHTMEGRRGMSVLEWVYFLDNYEEVLDHGVKAFADPENPPLIDVEPLRYTSLTYGSLTATKRAYRIPGDDGECFGWLVILDVVFAEAAKRDEFYWDLIRVLRRCLMWSEYAISYDRVLTNTDSYPELLATMVGESGPLPEIPPNARVLELGAGSGNLTRLLAEPSKGRAVVALENNTTMIEILRDKCQAHLREDAEGPGIFLVRQDASSLLGLQDGFFDYAVLNNTLYSLDDPEACLAETRRVLKPGGEVRISGPKTDTNLNRLFKKFKKELQAKSLYAQLREDFEHVETINRHALSDRLYRWSVDDVCDMLAKAGFSQITYTTDRAYAGQAMIVCAK